MRGDGRRLAIMRFVRRFRDENGYSPSVREITKDIGLKSTSTTDAHLKGMRADGLLTGGSLPRTLMLTQAGEELLAKEEERALSEKR